MDDEYCGLPTGFDINDNIPTLNQQLKKVPLSMYFYHLLMRMELDKAKRDGRTWYVNMSVIVKMMSIITCMHVYMCLCLSQDDVNYYVYAVYMWLCVKVWWWSCVYMCGRMWRFDEHIYWLTTHFDKVNHADRGLLNCWKNSRKEFTRSSWDR